MSKTISIAVYGAFSGLFILPAAWFYLVIVNGDYAFIEHVIKILYHTLLFSATIFLILCKYCYADNANMQDTIRMPLRFCLHLSVFALVSSALQAFFHAL